jgi:hypothetical protein
MYLSAVGGAAVSWLKLFQENIHEISMTQSVSFSTATTW